MKSIGKQRKDSECRQGERGEVRSEEKENEEKEEVRSEGWKKKIKSLERENMRERRKM